jgi:CBS domain-containing protein
MCLTYCKSQSTASGEHGAPGARSCETLRSLNAVTIIPDACQGVPISARKAMKNKEDTMQIQEIMTLNPKMLPADASILAAAEKMKDLNVGALPVEQDESVVGIITDRDIVVRGIAEDRDPEETSVRDIMSTDVVTCPADASVEDAVQAMEQYKVRRLVVTDRSGRPAGIVSLGDIATKAHRKVEMGGEALSRVSQPSQPSH